MIQVKVPGVAHADLEHSWIKREEHDVQSAALLPGPPVSKFMLFLAGLVVYIHLYM